MAPRKPRGTDKPGPDDWGEDAPGNVKQVDFSEGTPPAGDGDGLADAATSALDGMPDPTGGGSQDPFEGTDYTRVKFSGISYDALELDAQIGDELKFTVSGTITATGDEKMANGYIRHLVKVDIGKAGTVEFVAQQNGPEHGKRRRKQ